jgi:hypothetical protein
MSKEIVSNNMSKEIVAPEPQGADKKKREALPPPDLAFVWITLWSFGCVLFGMSIGLVFVTLFWAYVSGISAVLVVFFALLVYYQRLRVQRRVLGAKQADQPAR